MMPPETTTELSEYEPTTMEKALDIHPKVVSASVAGSITVVALYTLRAIWGVDPPPEVCAEITVIVGFVFGWLAPRETA